MPQVDEQIDGSVSRVMKDRVARVFPQECQIVAVAVPQVAEQFGAGVDVPVPLMLEEVVEVMKLMPYEQMSETICEPIVEVPVHRVAEQFIDVPKIARPRDVKEIEHRQEGIKRKYVPLLLSGWMECSAPCVG